jgi:hypothetical protein
MLYLPVFQIRIGLNKLLDPGRQFNVDPCGLGSWPGLPAHKKLNFISKILLRKEHFGHKHIYKSIFKRWINVSYEFLSVSLPPDPDKKHRIYTVLFYHRLQMSGMAVIPRNQCCGSALVSMQIRIKHFLSMRIRIRIRIRHFLSM